MTVARTTELSAVSEKSFDDAIEKAISRATNTLRNVKGAWVKDQLVEVENERIARYKVHLMVTFVLDE